MAASIEAYYRDLLSRAGISRDVGREGEALRFTLDGYSLDISLAASQWLRIECVALELAISASDQHQRALEMLNDLSARHVWIRYWLGDDRRVRVAWSSFLFASVTDSHGDGEPVASVGDVLPVFGLALEVLAGAVGALLLAFKSSARIPKWGLPGTALPMSDANELFANYLSAQGLTYFPVRSSRLPEIAFRCPESPWLFRVRLTAGRHGAYAMALPFLEQRRFRQGLHDNVLVGELQASILDACNAINAEAFGCKAYVDLGSGQLVVVAPGCIPPGAAQSFEAFLPSLRARLAETASTLIAFAGLDSRDYIAEAQERAKVGPDQAGLIHLEKAAANAWERSSGRALVERCLGQHGRIYSGYRIPTVNGAIEVDHIIVAETGIFVIECKAHSGLIAGTASSVWTFRQGGGEGEVRTARGVNPLEQSRFQIRALRRFIDARMANLPAPIRKKVNVSGVCLFPDEAELRLDEVDVNNFGSHEPAAFNLSKLIEHLNDRARRDKLLTWRQIELVSGLVANA